MNYTKKRRSRPAQTRRRNDRPSEINPESLIKKGTQKPREESKPAWAYAETNLHASIKSNLVRLGYTHPTPIQEQCMAPAIEGRDILGIAGTGTGKTAAFLIPMVQRLHFDADDARSLVVVPTRELALQVAREFDGLTKGTRFRAATFIGGRSLKSDFNALKRNNDVVIGTPGRLLDLYRQGALTLDGINTFILDEFDRMLDMGFLNDVQQLLDGLPHRRQTLFFSATVDKKQQRVINEILHDPVNVMIEQQNTASNTVEQELIRVEAGACKVDLLYDLIQEDTASKVLVFAETKRLVDQVSKKLSQRGVQSDVIHGDKSQNYRQKALAAFTAGRVQVLVATDVAARGLDVNDVSHVINYQLPQTMDSYIHRIGRTGRAGKQGRAYTFVD